MDNTIKILVVKDEVILADNISNTLANFGYSVLKPASTYKEAIKTIEASRPNIAILDVHLTGKKSSIDLAHKINSEYKFPFIFLASNSDKLTLDEAKQAKPFAFLIKPFVKEELFAAVELALFNFASLKERLVDKDNLVVCDALFIKQKNVFLRLNFTDITFIKSDHVYLDIYTTQGKKHTVRGTIREYLDKLDRNFIQIHRGHIINTKHLESINHITVQVNGKSLPVGKKHRNELLEKINLA
ncbi:MAG: LytTR family transcriptional regulator DNA-binding domain-containing protein [Crocinitomicaceae bacterium]|nr:LytTR family transcriptional regulator DNA-binding domain-containing protein [Crocinitomicaceae bacterium]